MRALIFDGSREGETGLEALRSAIEGEMARAGLDSETLDLRDMDIAPCTGCFKCWTKTPGICVIDDAGRKVTEKLVNCDLLVILTPVTFGGYSSEVKKALDRSMGWLLPYFTKVDGKTHHRPRYKHYPDLLVFGTTPTSDTDLEALFKDLVDRNAINAHSPKHRAEVVTDDMDKAAIGRTVRSALKAAGVVG
jgi:hypothetical protein